MCGFTSCHGDYYELRGVCLVSDQQHAYAIYLTWP